MYREQEKRGTALESFQGDYVGFLKDCQLEIGIAPLSEDNLRRVYELAQRTNQLNFSGNRYQAARLSEVMSSALLETFVIDCRDRFGDYGIVGFAIVDSRVPRLLDLMFSCRVQGKRVEHAVLAYLLKSFMSGNHRDFYVNYRQTPKNAATGKVFDELGFEFDAEDDSVTSLVFRHDSPIPD